MRGRWRRGTGMTYGAFPGGCMAPLRAEAAGTTGATPSSRQLPRARGGGSALDGVPEVAIGRQRGGVPVPTSRPPARRGAQSRWSRLGGRGRGMAEGSGGSGEAGRSGSAGDLMINSRRRWFWPRRRRGDGRGGSPHLFGRGRVAAVGTLLLASASRQPQGQEEEPAVAARPRDPPGHHLLLSVFCYFAV